MMEDYGSLTVREISRMVSRGERTAVDFAREALDRAETTGRHLNAIISLCPDTALRNAREIDRDIKNNKKTGILSGVPVLLKDNIVYRGCPTTCASTMLDGFSSFYDATVVEKLLTAGAIIIGKTNMDEFAMGSSGEYSAFGAIKNPCDEKRVSGGSSGGSCAAVAAGIVPLAMGSDTGGSVRQPAGFCGVVGMKPSYGAVSRYGLVAFASSTDQIGPIGRTVDDCALGWQAIVGYDPRDATSGDLSFQEKDFGLDGSLKIGIPRELLENDGIAPEIREAMKVCTTMLGKRGHSVEEVSLPSATRAIAVYYIIASAEASSNLARFDGVRFGLSGDRGRGVAALYETGRGDGFGREVKRRIMLGTYVLSTGYYDQYYIKAQKVREMLRREFDAVFSDVDVIMSPTTPTTAFQINAKTDTPLDMYLSDIMTVPASLAGIPAISVPCGKSGDGLPIGVQFMAPYAADQSLFQIANVIESLVE